MMTMLSMQDSLVTLIALGAAAILLRRVLGFARSSADSPCGHCTASPSKPAAPAHGNSPTATVFPLTLVRPAAGAPRSASAATAPRPAAGRSCHS